MRMKCHIAFYSTIIFPSLCRRFLGDFRPLLWRQPGCSCCAALLPPHLPQCDRRFILLWLRRRSLSLGLVPSRLVQYAFGELVHVQVLWACRHGEIIGGNQVSKPSTKPIRASSSGVMRRRITRGPTRLLGGPISRTCTPAARHALRYASAHASSNRACRCTAWRSTLAAIRLGSNRGLGMRSPYQGRGERQGPLHSN